MRPSLGSIEFFDYFPKGSQSIVIQPFEKGVILACSPTERGFSQLDQVKSHFVSEIERMDH